MQVHIYHLSFNPRPSGTKYVDIFAMEFYLLQTVWNEDTEEIWTSDSLLKFKTCFIYWSEF